MIIAKRGDFTLNTKYYIVDHEYSTFDIEICRWDEDGHKYSIAHFEPNDYDEEDHLYHGCDVVSYEGRLFDRSFTVEDLDDIRHLSNLGRKILTTTERVSSGFKVRHEIVTRKWDIENGCFGEKEVVGYSTEEDVE